jgi:hypothetical protein
MVFKRLYGQYVRRPHLKSASAAWSPWTETDKECLKKVYKKREVTMMTGLREETYEDRLLELGLTTLEERRHRLDTQQIYYEVRRRNKE